MDIFSNHILSMIFLAVTFICITLLMLSNKKIKYGVLTAVFSVLFILSYYNHGDINIVGILVFLIGLLFVGLELIVPGGFIAGIVGVLSMIVGISMIINNLYLAFLTVVIAITIDVLFILVFLSKDFDSSKFNKFVLKETNSKSFTQSSKKYLNKKGITITPLRPSGKIEIDGDYIDAITRGDFIPKGCEVVLLLVFFSLVPVGLWVTAQFSGVHVKISQLIGMRLRRVIPKNIINPLIKATKAGLNLTTNQLEAHYLAGGNVNTLVNALIAAQRADIELEFERAAAIDLAGRNVLEAVQVSVNPKVIETPNIAAVAMNGIEVIVKAKVTVRANIERLIGGAGEETIIARVGEGIVTTVGSSESHTSVLENPDSISKTVLNKGLDSGTAFEILSIDIADVDVGRNIGAKLQTDQAEADKRIAQAKAEERRAMAVAKEQEMIAEVRSMRAKVVESESKVPLAIAKALESGNLGVLDYYNMKNIISDTEMRQAISGNSEKIKEDDK